MGTTPFVWITASLVPETLLMFGLIKGYKQEVSVTAVTSTDESLPRLLRRNILAHNCGKRQDIRGWGRILAFWAVSWLLYIVGALGGWGALFWWLCFFVFFVCFFVLSLKGFYINQHKHTLIVIVILVKMTIHLWGLDSPDTRCITQDLTTTGDSCDIIL